MNLTMENILLSCSEDFQALLNYDIMATSNVALDLISWCDYFVSKEFTEDYIIDQTTILTVLFEKVNFENFYAWIVGLNKINKVNEDLRELFLEIQTCFAAQLEIETMNSPDHLDALIQEKLFWEKQSTKTVLEFLKKNQTLFSSEMSFTKRQFRLARDWLKEFAENTVWIPKAESNKRVQTDSSQSSGTPKKAKMDISTSIIPVSTHKATVDAYFSKVGF